MTLERRLVDSATESPPDVSAYVIDCPDWVNVVPLTADGRVVLVRQYRFGIDEVTYEVPGGVVDRGETPGAAATRELREETGYRSLRVEPVGIVAPNPAIQSNRCHMFLARDCQPVGVVELDSDEDIDVELVSRADALSMVHDGRISHALAQVALLRAFSTAAS